MQKKNFHMCIFLVSCFLLLTISAHAQSVNMLNEPFAVEDLMYWTSVGDAMIEDIGGFPCFVARNGGYFLQEVLLPETAAGKFALLAGVVSAKQWNTGGTITGLPYIYAYMMKPENTEENGNSVIQEYLLIQGTPHTTWTDDNWSLLWGIFQVPENTERIMVFLKQAKELDVPYSDSEARFDDLGVYLFASVEEAEAYIDKLYYQ